MHKYFSDITETETKVLKTLEQVKPSLLDESSNESTRRIIRKRIAERLGLSASSEGIFRSSSNSSLEEEESGEGRGESEMKRFLGFLSEQQRLREEAKDRSNCSEGYIKWEVKELLKFFTDEGLAKLKDSQTEVLLSRVKRVMPTQENVLWHRSTEKEDDVMDIVYNKGEDSEAMDRDRMEILKTHIGLHKETLCTGPSKSGGPDVIIPLRAKKTKSLPPNKSEEQRPLRTSPRKKKQQAAASSSNNASKEEVFKQKLRNAVFNALSSKGIGMKHELFRPCFKKLFEICKMYTGSKVPGGQGSTKEWLNKVALQNVDPVINLEKTLHGS
ncbi:Putative LOC100898669 [Caligus rogercresseyi]|uniref:LOC100898669 n=1 Tax=Caligus rogercresseyi TaxID=217165 RepID=A0A7T8GQL2_CALRO|nr:Putative LOC100898669 [Caligus rogercresseyi]